MNLDEMTTMTHEMVGRLEALEGERSTFEEQIDALEKAAETNAAAIDAFAAMILEDDVLLGIARLLIASHPGGVQITPALQLVAETEERDTERRAEFMRANGVAP